MTNGTIAFLLALGISAWVYNFSMKQTGGQTKTALIIAATVGVILFIIAISLISLIPE